MSRLRVKSWFKESKYADGICSIKLDFTVEEVAIGDDMIQAGKESQKKVGKYPKWINADIFITQTLSPEKSEFSFRESSEFHFRRSKNKLFH